MILAPGTVLCDCNRGVGLYLHVDTAATTHGELAAAIGAAYLLAGFVARLTAVARGWAVLDEAHVRCDRCLDRPDIGTVYQDSGPDWGRR